MQGIDFLVDEHGHKKAAVDLQTYGAVFEDFIDGLIAKQRQDEPQTSLANMRQKMLKK